MLPGTRLAGLGALLAVAALLAIPPVLASHMPYAGATGWDIWTVGTYLPPVMVAQPGDTVTWYGFGHTATAIDGAFDLTIGGLASWQVPADEGPAVHVYYCAIHPYMLGALVVV